MPLYFFYTMVQKSKKWPKTQIKGALPYNKSNQESKNFLRMGCARCVRERFMLKKPFGKTVSLSEKNKNRLKIQKKWGKDLKIQRERERERERENERDRKRRPSISAIGAKLTFLHCLTVHLTSSCVGKFIIVRSILASFVQCHISLILIHTVFQTSFLLRACVVALPTKRENLCLRKSKSWFSLTGPSVFSLKKKMNQTNINNYWD